MKKIIFCAAMLASVLVSCVKKESAVSEPQKEMASLEIRLVSEETKVAGPGGDEEKSVSNYQIMIFDMSSRMLEAYATPSVTASDISMVCTTGPKEIVVLANAPDVSSIVSYDTFIKTKSLLEHNRIGMLVMEGHAPADLTAAGGTVDVEIRRIISKVVLDGVTVDFESDAYDEMDFVINKVYLTNVAADKTYLSEDADPQLWYNKNAHIAAPEINSLVYQELAGVNLKNSKEYKQQHHFYCYPNPHTEDSFSTEWDERPTRLVLEATLGGVRYYYPVALPELLQNTRYHVSLHVKRPGATSPEQDMDKYSVSFNITVKEWEGQENVSETI